LCHYYRKCGGTRRFNTTAGDRRLVSGRDRAYRLAPLGSVETETRESAGQIVKFRGQTILRPRTKSASQFSTKSLGCQPLSTVGRVTLYNSASHSSHTFWFRFSPSGHPLNGRKTIPSSLASRRAISTTLLSAQRFMITSSRVIMQRWLRPLSKNQLPAQRERDGSAHERRSIPRSDANASTANKGRRRVVWFDLRGIQWTAMPSPI